MYGRILHLDYEDSDSVNILVMIDCSKGVRKVYLSEDRLVKKSCGPESFKLDLESSQNLIVALRPYIQGHISLKDASPSPVKAPKKVSKVQSRPGKRNISKMSDSDSSSSAKDEVTTGAKLESGVLSSEKNYIRTELMQRKLVRKGHVFNLPITHIHRPPVDVKKGRRSLEIREPHRMHVQNLKKKIKINPNAIIVPFIVMVDPIEKQAQQNYVMLIEK